MNKTGDLCLAILAKPGAKETLITGTKLIYILYSYLTLMRKIISKTDIDDEVIKCSISAPPVDGEANKELIRYISKLLKLRNSDVTLDKVQIYRFEMN